MRQALFGGVHGQQPAAVSQVQAASALEPLQPGEGMAEAPSRHEAKLPSRHAKLQGSSTLRGPALKVRGPLGQVGPGPAEPVSQRLLSSKLQHELSLVLQSTLPSTNRSREALPVPKSIRQNGHGIVAQTGLGPRLRRAGFLRGSEGKRRSGDQCRGCGKQVDQVRTWIISDRWGVLEICSCTFAAKSSLGWGRCHRRQRFFRGGFRFAHHGLKLLPSNVRRLPSPLRSRGALSGDHRDRDERRRLLETCR
mmetsp:Transcript_24903/g.59137  ORF Transcript_24903/g.59137 Transcript_24903/m.59137 type:complete len:251 (+) Transcript_24903:1076-1828(+)